MQRLLGTFALLLLAACATSSGSGWTSCDRDEERGCIQMDLLLVSNQQRPMVRDLVSGRRKATESGFGRELYVAVKSGEIALDQRCVPMTVNVWGVNPVVPHSAAKIRSFALRRGKAVETSSGVAVRVTPTPVLADGHRPDTAYEVVVCGGMGSIQLPWEALPPGAMILICPSKGNTVYPDRVEGATDGLWVYADELNRWRNEGRSYTLIPLVAN